jgi:hypothetical protein
MSWHDAWELHIYAPSEEPYGENWVEQVLGTIVRPLHEQYKDDIRWTWVTRYAGQYNPSAPPYGYELPEQYHANGGYRYILLRVSIKDESKESLHDQAIQLARTAGCFTNPNGWINYDVRGDLGNDRFVRADAGLEDRARRAQLIAYFIDATVKLMLDSIIQTDDGRWILEPNAHHVQNPEGSFFQSVHHLLCNLTGVPTFVLLSNQNNRLLATTYIARSLGQAAGIPLTPDTVLPRENEWYPLQLWY